MPVWFAAILTSGLAQYNASSLPEMVNLLMSTNSSQVFYTVPIQNIGYYLYGPFRRLANGRWLQKRMFHDRKCEFSSRELAITVLSPAVLL